MFCRKSEKKAGLALPEIGHVEAFAMIVDINGFVGMVDAASTANDSIAQFTRDVLAGAVEAIETVGGEVVGFMGDAILGVLPTVRAAVDACYLTAKDVDDVCEWVSGQQNHHHGGWDFAPGGPTVKIAVEFGRLDVSTISSRLLGTQRILVGNAINHAARISRAGIGNRCLVGPVAAAMEFASYPITGPYEIGGKSGEESYTYFQLSMDEVWVEGPRVPGEDTHRD